MNTMILDSTREIIRRTVWESDYRNSPRLNVFHCFFHVLLKMPAKRARNIMWLCVLRHAKNMNSLPTQLMRLISLSRHILNSLVNKKRDFRVIPLESYSSFYISNETEVRMKTNEKEAKKRNLS